MENIKLNNNGRSRVNNLIFLFDNIVIEMIISFKNIKFFFLYLFSDTFKFLKNNAKLKDLLINKKVFILGNGPSINKYDLTKLNNQNVIMVNRSFKHKDYEIIKPNFHFFVDNKMSNGIWPLTYVDEVFLKNPTCKIFLNADWYHLSNFKNLRNNKQIYWIKFTLISLINDNFKSDFTKIVTAGSSVVDCAITLSIHLGSTDINILGVEGNGIAHLMCNQDSHFNGKDVDYDDHNSLLFANDMISNARAIRQWHQTAKFLKKRKINIYNLTNEGILDAYKYKNFNESLLDN